MSGDCLSRRDRWRSSLNRVIRCCAVVVALTLTRSAVGTLTATSVAVGGLTETTNHSGDAVAVTIPLTWPSGQPSDLIISVAVCGERAFLLSTPRLATIFVANLATKEIVSRIGKSGRGPGELMDPVALVADCGANLLYVVEVTHGITVFSTTDGRYVRTYQIPRLFVPSPNSTVLLSDDGGHLHVGGLWPEEVLGYLKAPRSSMFEHVKLGWALSLTDETSVPLFSPLEKGCRADTSTCRRVFFDQLSQSRSGSQWIVAHAGVPQVGVHDASGRRIKTMDVRSQLFRTDSSAVNPGDPSDVAVSWSERNSTVLGLYSFRDIIAVVHGFADPGWERGKIAQFNVYLNTFRQDGTRLTSDVKLPALPVGRDKTGLWTIDYGPQGRRSDFKSLSLGHITI